MEIYSRVFKSNFDYSNHVAHEFFVKVYVFNQINMIFEKQNKFATMAGRPIFDFDFT